LCVTSEKNPPSPPGDGTLNAVAPAANEPADSYTYDPLHPVPTAGGAMIGGAAGIARQNDIEGRNDVLVYTTPLLNQDVEVTGPISLILYVSTSAPNTDFTAKLVDVHQDGSAFNISEGILRRSYQDVQRPPYPQRTYMKFIFSFGLPVWYFSSDIESGWRYLAATSRALIAIQTPGK
jgi:hypothetical protein